jgi:hypothetical protein
MFQKSRFRFKKNELENCVVDHVVKRTGGKLVWWIMRVDNGRVLIYE